MFNQLTPADVVTAIGTTLRGAARSEDRTSDFERDQLMSAYSATRHLAAELSGSAPIFDAYAEALAARIAEAAAREDALAGELAAFARRLEAGRTPAVVGALVGDVLARLRDEGDPAAQALCQDVRALTRRLADDEVDLLADGLSRS